MRFERFEIEGPRLVHLRIYRDPRGFFVERFREDLFAQEGLPTRFHQDNHSRSAPGVLRGLHFQVGAAQGKLVGVTRGAIFDVAVDLRAGSPTYGRSVHAELGGDNGRLLWVPEGFAHGFVVLGDEPADVCYKVTTPHAPAGQRGVHWADPDLAIPWPVTEPLLSEADRAWPSFAAYRAAPEF